MLLKHLQQIVTHSRSSKLSMSQLLATSRQSVTYDSACRRHLNAEISRFGSTRTHSRSSPENIRTDSISFWIFLPQSTSPRTLSPEAVSLSPLHRDQSTEYFPNLFFISFFPLATNAPLRCLNHVEAPPSYLVTPKLPRTLLRVKLHYVAAVLLRGEKGRGKKGKLIGASRCFALRAAGIVGKDSNTLEAPPSREREPKQSPHLLVKAGIHLCGFNRSEQNGLVSPRLRCWKMPQGPNILMVYSTGWWYEYVRYA